MLYGYTNAYLTDDIDFGKSTFGYMMTFATREVSWQLRLQKCVVLSTTRDDYIAANEAFKVLF